MQVKILNKKVNRLLKREEIEFTISDTPTTPSRKKLLQKIAETLNTKPEFVSIQKIEQPFGIQENKAWARVYETREALEQTESKHLMGRDRGEKVQPGKKGAKTEEKAPAPAEAPKPEEKPEAKEESKKEESPKEAPKEETKPVPEEKKE
ncbi:30S ribosomal protein S24e [Candidatus Micrarchaeota archaeon]|nr:30S ribosomal protein S24e [Candidatus Micrarchaeota archaeon]MBU1930067.1 30S ribosomal protein S24e [Candidatus Micrarchaeota archaeon]